MLPINRIREYQAEVIASLVDDDDKKLFNFADLIVDDAELSQILKERTDEQNTFLIAVMPDYRVKGGEDNAQWENMLQFFVLNKTSYSDFDRDGYHNIFVETQIKAKAFIDKLLFDKANHTGNFCGFLNKLDESSIFVYPVKNKDGCNGWGIEINLDTAL